MNFALMILWVRKMIRKSFAFDCPVLIEFRTPRPWRPFFDSTPICGIGEEPLICHVFAVTAEDAYRLELSLIFSRGHVRRNRMLCGTCYLLGLSGLGCCVRACTLLGELGSVAGI